MAKVPVPDPLQIFAKPERLSRVGCFEVAAAVKGEDRPGHHGQPVQARSVLEGLEADVVTFNQVHRREYCLVSRLTEAVEIYEMLLADWCEG